MTDEVLRIDARITAINIEDDGVEYVLHANVDETTEALIREVGSMATVGIVLHGPVLPRIPSLRS